MKHIILGNVSITRVWEYFGSVEMTPDTFFPESSKEVWETGTDWLAPHFLDSETNIVNSAIQTWLLRSEGRTILVDTGVGNHKERPYAPVWSHLETDFLANLARAGVRPEDVDIVINTHLHIDHVGWNTYLDGRRWVPTFPNATYLMPKDDFDFWNPENGHQPLLGRGNQNVFEDSVAPVHQAGQTQLWEHSHQIDANLRLDTAPGHTPGSSVLTLTSGTDRAVFVGDMLHSLPQLMRECDVDEMIITRRHADIQGARIAGNEDIQRIGQLHHHGVVGVAGELDLQLVPVVGAERLADRVADGLLVGVLVEMHHAGAAVHGEGHLVAHLERPAELEEPDGDDDEHGGDDGELERHAALLAAPEPPDGETPPHRRSPYRTCTVIAGAKVMFGMIIAS
jgi:glyoxylase-like metal-dependent hydrolase (beta-lactamase superfamily II)